MADFPPYMNAYGAIPKILNRIKEAKTPDRFTQDFLGTALGFSGGSYKAFIPFAKRVGLLGSDGTPTALYRSFRNPAESGAAIASALRQGYGELYRRNEYAHQLDKPKLEGLVMEVTGLEKGSSAVRAICGSFEALKQFSDFERSLVDASPTLEKKVERTDSHDEARGARAEGSALRLSYTLYLNLPNTTDINVFNAIFKSLREHLLQ